MSARMAHALMKAAACWEKAIQTEPEFVRRYLELAEQLLITNREIDGDEFKRNCVKNRVMLPDTLHHNTWGSGVTALKTIGWIQRIGEVEPSAAHNHMNTVVRWRSTLCDQPMGIEELLA